MHVSSILQRFLAARCPSVHKTRLQSLLAAVSALLRGRILTLTALGRELASSTSPKHAIKRMDRLLGNPHLHAELPLFYAALTSAIVAKSSRPLVVVDWSDIPTGPQHCLLRAALPLHGRALTVYEEIHPLSKLSNPRVEADFLRHLQALLPATCCPIIITDAGFAGPWFAAVRAWGWDVIGRVRNTSMKYQRTAQSWASITSFFKRCTSSAQCFGSVLLCKSRPYAGRLIGVKARKTAWLLFTTLPAGSHDARHIVKCYRLRMHIEEAFRDIKSSRYGFAWRASGTQHIQRLRVLLVIAALAVYLLYVVAAVAKQSRQHHQLQANSTKNRAVLSVTSIGFWMLRRGFKLTLATFSHAADTLALSVYNSSTA